MAQDPTGVDSNGATTTIVSNPPYPPTTNTVPNTTTNTQTVEYQTAANNNPVATSSIEPTVLPPVSNAPVATSSTEPTVLPPVSNTPVATSSTEPTVLPPVSNIPVSGQTVESAVILPVSNAPVIVPSSTPGEPVFAVSKSSILTSSDQLLASFDASQPVPAVTNTPVATSGYADSPVLLNGPYNSSPAQINTLTDPQTPSTALPPGDSYVYNLPEVKKYLETEAQLAALDALRDTGGTNTFVAERDPAAIEAENSIRNSQAEQAALLQQQGILQILQRDAALESQALAAARPPFASLADYYNQQDAAEATPPTSTPAPQESPTPPVDLFEGPPVEQIDLSPETDPNIDAAIAAAVADETLTESLIDVVASDDPATANLNIPLEVFPDNTAATPVNEEDPVVAANLAAAVDEQPQAFIAEGVDETDPEVEYYQQLQAQNEFDAAQANIGSPAEISPEDDPFEASRLAAADAFNDNPDSYDAEDVQLLTDQEADALEEQQAENRRILAEEAADFEYDPEALGLPPGAEPDEPPTAEPYALNPDEDPSAAAIDAANQADAFYNGTAGQTAGSEEAATRAKAQQQATLQSRYKQPGNTDWRVRLSLGPNAQYLYNDPSADVLKPLSANGGTNGIIFPYTPTITTVYSANYEQYDLVHSNYRGIFYKNSRVGDISVRGMFTAQDTTEANYLLAVIHFFRSVTKMFYGQDAQRGTPPPICFLNGFGQHQFSNHPVVVSSFNYTLPNDVDYIRTSSPNNFGLNLLDRYNQTPTPLPAGGALAGLMRLKNALLTKGAQPPQPGPYNSVPGTVTNQTLSSFVPTKMEIDITLIPVQTRSQVSQQFSLKGFANGDLLKGGFW